MKIHPSPHGCYEKTITQARWDLTYELIEQMYTIFKRERINSQHSQHSHPYFCFSFSAQLVRLCDHEDFYNPLLQMVYFPLFLPLWELNKTEKYLILLCKEKKNNLDHGKGVFLWNSLSAQVCMSANERIWSEIKRSDKQLLKRRLIFKTFLPKFNAENFILSQFVLSGTNGPTRGKLFFVLFSGGRFTEVATYSKSYWKHWLPRGNSY